MKSIPAAIIFGGGEGGGGNVNYVVKVATDDTLNGKTLTFSKSGCDSVTVTVTNNEAVASIPFNENSIGEWVITENLNRHIVTIDLRAVDYYETSIKSYIMYGFKVDSSIANSTNAVSYNVEYNGEKVKNYNYTNYGRMQNISSVNSTWSWGDWKEDEFFIPRPCLISQDYSSKIYLDPNDYTKDVNGDDVTSYLTGSIGDYNAMMEWGRDDRQIWYKLVPAATPTTYTCFVADQKVDDDFVAWAFYDANDNLGEHFYTAIYGGSTVSNCMRSLSGKNYSALSVELEGATQISYAKANNKNGESYAWYIDVLADRILIELLLYMLTKTLNTDISIGYGHRSGGSQRSHLLTTGTLNTKGMFYGTTANETTACKVFGMENLFSDSWRRLVGLVKNANGVLLYKLTYGTADGTSTKGYIESDGVPSNYKTGNTISNSLSQAYISAKTAKTDGSLLMSANSGASITTYYADASWSSTNVATALVGGRCSMGADCGFSTLNLYVALSYSAWDSAASLSLKPLAS